MDASRASSSSQTSGNTGEVLELRDEPSNTALKDLTSSFQAEIMQRIEKFNSEVEAVALQVSPLGQQEQLRKAEAIIQIQTLTAFITNKLHEHQLMERLDPKH